MRCLRPPKAYAFGIPHLGGEPILGAVQSSRKPREIGSARPMSAGEAPCISIRSARLRSDTARVNMAPFGQDKRFVFHCASGLRSALTVSTLVDMGFDAAHLKDGFSSWVAHGGPVKNPDLSEKQ